MHSLSNTTFFTKFKPQRYITTPRSWKLTVSNIQTMKLSQGSEQNPANSVKPEERSGSKNGRYKSVKSAQTNARPSIYMRPGYRTKSHSSGEDLEGNQGSLRVSKIFVDLRLAIKDLMQSKCHGFFIQYFLGKTHSKPPWGWVLNKVSYTEAPP